MRNKESFFSAYRFPAGLFMLILVACMLLMYDPAEAEQYQDMAEAEQYQDMTEAESYQDTTEAGQSQDTTEARQSQDTTESEQYGDMAVSEQYWSIAELNIRDLPDGDIIGMYHTGESVNVIQEQGEWFLTDRGYVSSMYLTSDPAYIPRGEYLAYDVSEFPLTYTDDTLSITIYREKGYGSVWYAANVILSDPARLKTMYPGGAWGGHATASDAYREVGGCILMINGDFRDPTNAQNLGIVRDGKIINNQTMKKASIGLTQDGDLVSTRLKDPSEVLAMHVRDTFSFGPFLVWDGKAVSHKNTEIHPRTFIGQVSREDEQKEYWLIVADGRWNGYSDGLTRDAMTQILLDKGCRIGFNLDGGGSSVMLFQGNVINRPSDGHQRENADYIYIK